jgi:hypothetical protein
VQQAILQRLDSTVHGAFSNLFHDNCIALLRIEETADGDRPDQLCGARYLLDFTTSPHTHPDGSSTGRAADHVRFALAAYAACASAALQPANSSDAPTWRPWPRELAPLCERPADAPEPACVWIMLANRVASALARHTRAARGGDADRPDAPTAVGQDALHATMAQRVADVEAKQAGLLALVKSRALASNTPTAGVPLLQL